VITSSERRLHLVALLLVAMLSPSTLSAQVQVETIHVAAGVPIEPAAEVEYARQLGLFTKAGLAMQYEPPMGVGSTAPAVASGAVDIAYLTIDALALAHQKKVPFVLVAPAAIYIYPTSEHVAGLVVPANSTLQNAKDFEGKSLATQALNTMSEYAPRAWIDRSGADSSKVRFVEIPFPAMPAALTAGRIDAAWIPEPFLTIAKQQGNKVVTYWTESIGPQFLISGWYATRQWASAHPEALRRFRSVIHDTAVWANANQDKTAPMIATYAHLDSAVVASMGRSRYAEQLTPALIQPVVDMVAKYSGFPTFPADEMLFTPSR
jgi:NitT/TauT family transport system substrate-binding protein